MNGEDGTINRVSPARMASSQVGSLSQHDDRHGERALGLLAVADVPRLMGHTATLGQVPGGGAWVLRVRVVRSGLAMDGDGPDGSENTVDDQAEQRIEEVHDVEDGFDEQDEHGQHGDGDVPVGDTEPHPRHQHIRHSRRALKHATGQAFTHN